jgi:hypothetical protein
MFCFYIWKISSYKFFIWPCSFLLAFKPLLTALGIKPKSKSLRKEKERGMYNVCRIAIPSHLAVPLMSYILSTFLPFYSAASSRETFLLSYPG